MDKFLERLVERLSKRPLLLLVIGTVLLAMGWAFGEFEDSLKGWLLPPATITFLSDFFLGAAVFVWIGAASLLGSRAGPIRSAWKRYCSNRYMALHGIAEIRGSDINFDKGEILASKDTLYIVMHDGFRFFEKYAEALRKRFDENLPTSIVILDEASPHLANLALKSGKTHAEQIRDIKKATEFYLYQQRAKPAGRIVLGKTERILTYSFIGTNEEAIVAFYPTSQRWEHRVALHLGKRVAGSQTPLLENFFQDVAQTARNARLVPPGS